MPVRILIVDDHEAARNGLRSLLCSRPDFTLCGQAADGLEAIAQCKSLRPDLVLMDISMPRMDGLTASRAIMQELPATKIIIVSQNDPSVVTAQAQQIGAAGFVSKANLADDLMPNIDKIVGDKGGRPFEGSVPATDNPALRWIKGDGEMAVLMRSTDWRKTPLGPPERWSPTLRLMVNFLLANRFPQLLWWGPEFCSVYNDAYIPVLGTKHPWALARPVAEVWQEIWDVLKPLIETPFHGGPATWAEDIELAVNRRGYKEETHFTIAYSPVPDDTVASGIGGVLATVHEITEKVIGERRIVALRELGVESAEADSAEKACINAAKTLAAHKKDIPFVMLYLTEAKRERAVLVAASGVDESDPGCPKIFENLRSPSNSWPVAEMIETEKIHLVQDISSKFATPPKSVWEEAVTSAALVPIRSNIAHRLAGFMIVGLSPRSQFDANYRNFLELMSTQIATTVANATAYQEERQRAQALAELDRAKTAFFSNISHEFRTPLTLMLGPLEDALAHADDRVPAELYENVLVARRNSLRLLKLVNSLLDFSRIEAGRVQAVYEPTDLASFTADLASVFRSAIQRAGLQLQVNCEALPGPVYVDRDMWEKIVLNLLSNALKFTFEGEIRVELKATDKNVQLTVADTGTGIPEAELPRLFERFHRVEGARGRTFEGTGIGLALVQELTHLHEGSVKVDSEYGKGSTFTVTIPMGKSHLRADRVETRRTLASTSVRADSYVEEALRWLPGEEEPASTPAAVLSSLSAGEVEKPDRRIGEESQLILLADDNADMRKYLTRLLGERYRVHAVSNGEQALAALSELSPDLVLTDVMMPGTGGFEILKRLRENPSTRATPVILLSARAGEESRVEGLQAGADDYLVKPFTARELLARVRAHLTMARIRRDAAERERELRRALERAHSELEMKVRDRTSELQQAEEDLRALSARLLQTQDEERRHIARELHDSAGQTLAVLGMQLALIGRKAENTLPEVSRETKNAAELLQQLKKEIRTTSYLLHPPLLDEIGLSSAVDWYIEGLKERSGLDIQLIIPADFGRVPRNTELVIFRLVQESLTNIHRHSGATKACIHLTRSDAAVSVEVTDNGKGMPREKLLEVRSGGHGVGLRGMRERVRQFRGEMRIESDSSGTRIQVILPLPKAEEERTHLSRGE